MACVPTPLPLADNSGDTLISQTATSKRRFFRYGSVGSPDIFAMHKGACFGIEMKGEKEKQRDVQKRPY